MDITTLIQVSGSLIWSNGILIVVIFILLFIILKRKKTYAFYNKNIRKPIKHFNKVVHDSITPKIPQTYEGLVIYHRADFNFNDASDDPYSKISLMSLEDRKKFCVDKIEEIRKRVYSYYQFTDCFIKPKDVNELEIYKRELNKLNSL